ncbi:hypothetical protein MRY87_06905 [bacterium]|nr:hypothetical protein [bacterium]
MTSTESEDQNTEQLLASLRVAFQEHLDKTVRSTLQEVFRQRRELWKESVFELFGACAHPASKPSLGQEGSGSAEWIAIASLSQLRKEVGGRFQNLRTRWLEAGFPLKAHRGDSTEDYTLAQDGWREMTSWLLKQGYESRLLEDLSLGYFEIRKP